MILIWNAKKNSCGADYNRVNLLMAVLEKRAGIHLSGSDAYVNIAGGMKVNEPAMGSGDGDGTCQQFQEPADDGKYDCFRRSRTCRRNVVL